MRRELLACGQDAEGQLGVRCNTDNPVIRVPEHIIGAPSGEHGSTVIDVACGEKHTVLLAEDGKIWSVGANDEGQLGRGSRNGGSFTIYPVNLSAGAKVIQVVAGRAHSLAVLEDGRLFAWGSNSCGQLALKNSIQFADSPKRVAMPDVVQVACGPNHCIALLGNGCVFVWGEQYDGAKLHTPTQVSQLAGTPIVRVAAGYRHYMALSTCGSVYVWGQNEFGQLGLGDTLPRATPVRLQAVQGMHVVELAAGYSHSILLTSEGRLFVFGSDEVGQLGCGRKSDRQTVPVAVIELIGSTVSRVACGRCHTVAVVGGRLYPFGLNSSGQLGNGHIRNQITPRPTDELDHVAAVFSGWDQTFIIRASGVPDVSPSANIQLRQPVVLTKSAVLALLAKQDTLEVICLLESVFSSLSTLNGSFLHSDHRRFLSSDSKQCGLDMDAVMETFNALAASSDAKKYSDLIIDTCQMSIFVDGDIDLSGPDVTAECLRAFLILPWLGAFVNNVTKETVKNLHVPFAHQISRLRPASRKILETWWTLLPKRHFNRMVSAMVAAVRCMVGYKVQPLEIRHILDVLISLNNINKVTNVIPLESFYVGELNANYDLKMDYALWTRDNIQSTVASNHWANYPFLMNGIAKGDLFYVEALIHQQMTLAESQGTLMLNGLGLVWSQQPFFSIHVRRDNLVHDTVNALLSASTRDLLKPLKIEFANEEAEDAGGVKKEFFMLLFQQILAPEYAMFTEDPNSHLVWFSGLDMQDENQFRLLGILCSLAVYNSVLVAFPFPLALYKLLLNQHATLEDLCELSPIEGRSLQSLLDYEGDDFEDIFGLTFTISYSQFGAATTVELKPRGADLSVTQHNKTEYVNLYVKHRMEIGLNNVISRQMKQFADGFRLVLQSRVLDFFQPRELMEMVVGNENYDWTDFRNAVQYSGEYYEKHPTILAFWNAFFKLSLDERKKFIQFLMGTTRLPVKGLSAVEIHIQPCAPELLPAAHTCSNMLDLPKITDEEELLRRLRISIEHTEGFTLT